VPRQRHIGDLTCKCCNRRPTHACGSAPHDKQGAGETGSVRMAAVPRGATADNLTRGISSPIASSLHGSIGTTQARTARLRCQSSSPPRYCRSTSCMTRCSSKHAASSLERIPRRRVAACHGPPRGIQPRHDIAQTLGAETVVLRSNRSNSFRRPVYFEYRVPASRSCNIGRQIHTADESSSSSPSSSFARKPLANGSLIYACVQQSLRPLS